MKNDILEHRKAVQQNIMKSFGVEVSEDSFEKGFEEDINPFEMEAYKSELTKAELDEFEKAKHQDGDMHPNGKWVWRASANGGKGDWRVAKKGSSTTSGGSGSAGASGGSDSRVSAFMSALKVVNSKFTDENKIKVVKTDKGNWDTTYDGHRIGIIRGSFLSEKVAKEKGWLEEDDKDTKKSSNTVTHDINGTKVTVTKNSDGSYTLEANGKKVKSDDPSFFVNGTNLKPRVKAALAKEVGLKQKNGKEIPNTMVEIHKDLDKKYEDEIKPFTYTSNGVSDLKKQGKTGYALWVGFEHAVRGRQPVDRTKMKNFVQNTAIKHLLKEVNERTGKKISEKDVKIDDRWDTTDMFRIYVEF